MPTGDIQNNLTCTSRAMSAVGFKQPIDVHGLETGNPTAILPLIHHILLEFSRPLATLISSKGYHLYGKPDLRFIEGVYRCLRDEFSYKPSLTVTQFFAMGFAERKMIFTQDISRLALAKHVELGGKKAHVADTVKTDVRSKNISRKSSKKRGTALFEGKTATDDTGVVPIPVPSVQPSTHRVYHQAIYKEKIQSSLSKPIASPSSHGISSRNIDQRNTINSDDPLELSVVTNNTPSRGAFETEKRYLETTLEHVDDATECSFYQNDENSVIKSSSPIVVEALEKSQCSFSPRQQFHDDSSIDALDSQEVPSSMKAALNHLDNNENAINVSTSKENTSRMIGSTSTFSHPERRSSSKRRLFDTSVTDTPSARSPSSKSHYHRNNNAHQQRKDDPILLFRLSDVENRLKKIEDVVSSMESRLERIDGRLGTDGEDIVARIVLLEGRLQLAEGTLRSSVVDRSTESELLAPKQSTSTEFIYDNVNVRNKPTFSLLPFKHAEKENTSYSGNRINEKVNSTIKTDMNISKSDSGNYDDGKNDGYKSDSFDINDDIREGFNDGTQAFIRSINDRFKETQLLLESYRPNLLIASDTTM